MFLSSFIIWVLQILSAQWKSGPSSPLTLKRNTWCGKERISNRWFPDTRTSQGHYCNIQYRVSWPKPKGKCLKMGTRWPWFSTANGLQGGQRCFRDDTESRHAWTSLRFCEANPALLRHVVQLSQSTFTFSGSHTLMLHGRCSQKQFCWQHGTRLLVLKTADCGFDYWMLCKG